MGVSRVMPPLGGITPLATQNKLRSIFANYDAAMREALESGLDANLLDDMVEFTEEVQ